MEDPNENNKGKPEVLTKEDFMKLFISNLEKGEAEADRIVVEMISAKVPDEFKNSVAQSLQNIKRELKAQFMLKSEVTASDFYDQLAGRDQVHDREYEEEKKRLELESSENLKKLVDESKAGIEAIKAGTESNDKKLKYMQVLNESYTERETKILDDLFNTNKKLLEGNAEKSHLRANEIYNQVMVDLASLSEEFWTTYLEKANVLVEELKP